MKYIFIAVPETLWYQHKREDSLNIRWYSYVKGANRYKVCAVKFNDFKMPICGGLDIEKLKSVVGSLEDFRIELQVCEDPAAFARGFGMIPEDVEVNVS